mgnify:CR=1 FL=1
MKNSIHQSITYELRDIVNRHMDEVRLYLPSPDGDIGVPEDVLAHLKRLTDICVQPSGHTIAPEWYQDVIESKQCIESFLRVMNQTMDADFYATEIGHILSQSEAWCHSAAVKSGLTALEAWDFIAPVKPDHLTEVEAGLYEAQWWKPIPWMDVEILRRTDGIVIQYEERDPKRLPGGFLVRFSIVPS